MFTACMPAFTITFSVKKEEKKKRHNSQTTISHLPHLAESDQSTRTHQHPHLNH